MKRALTLMVAGVLTVMFCGVCFAEEDEMVQKWREKCRRQVVIVIRSYLKAQPAPVRHQAIRELVRLQVLLGTVTNRPKDIILDKVNPDDLDRVAGQVLMIYLRDKGISMDAKEFFEGKQLRYVVKES